MLKEIMIGPAHPDYESWRDYFNIVDKLNADIEKKFFDNVRPYYDHVHDHKRLWNYLVNDYKWKIVLEHSALRIVVTVYDVSGAGYQETCYNEAEIGRELCEAALRCSRGPD